MYASTNGHNAPMELLLAAKANVDQTDEYGHKALCWAATKGHSVPVKLLLAAKAPVDQTDNKGLPAVTALALTWEFVLDQPTS